MAESGVILPSDSNGKALRSETVTTAFTTGSGGVVHQQVVTLADSAGNLLGTSAAGLPVVMTGSGGQAPIAGSITAAGANTPGTASTANTTGQVVANTALAGNATFHLVTSAFVGTVIFEGSVDAGLNYAPLMAIREDGTGSENSIAISTAAAFIRQYTVALPGLTYFRVRASAFTSGSVAVIIAPGPTLFEPSPSLAASSSQIGTIGELRASPLAVTATAALTTAATLTLPAAGAGLFHYITSLAIDLYSAAARTGAAAPWVVTTTNLPGSPAFTFSSAGAIGAIDRYILPMTTPLRSSVANTATTVVAPAATGGIWRLNATYFTAT
jgi:hypothetical protein